MSGRRTSGRRISGRRISGHAHIWDRLLSGPESDTILQGACARVAEGLSGMTGRPIEASDPRVKHIALAQVDAHLGAPEAEMVGIYLRLEAGLQGQAIFVIPLPIALNLVDLLMDARPGTSVELGLMERSALAEVGNLMLSYFLNAVADLAEVAGMLQPSPPEVMVDMLGAILDVVMAPAAFVSDELLVIESLFRDRARTIWIRFWVLPAPDIVEGSEG